MVLFGRLTYTQLGISDRTKTDGVAAALALDSARAGHAAYYFGSRSTFRHIYSDFRHSRHSHWSSSISQQRRVVFIIVVFIVVVFIIVVFIIDMCVPYYGPAISFVSLRCIVSADKKASIIFEFSGLRREKEKVCSFRFECCTPNVFVLLFWLQGP
jgi:hypothetical protein